MKTRTCQEIQHKKWLDLCLQKEEWMMMRRTQILSTGAGEEVEDRRSLVSRKLSVYQLLCHHNFVQQYCWLWSPWNQFIEWYYLFTIWAISLWCISLEKYCSSMSIINCAPELSYLIGYQCHLLTRHSDSIVCVCACVCASVCVCVCVCVCVSRSVSRLTHWLNPGLPHSRQILYCLRYQGRPNSISIISFGSHV